MYYDGSCLVATAHDFVKGLNYAVGPMPDEYSGLKINYQKTGESVSVVRGTWITTQRTEQAEHKSVVHRQYRELCQVANR